MILKLQKGKIIKQLVKYTAPKATEMSSVASKTVLGPAKAVTKRNTALEHSIRMWEDARFGRYNPLNIEAFANAKRKSNYLDRTYDGRYIVSPEESFLRRNVGGEARVAFMLNHPVKSLDTPTNPAPTLQEEFDNAMRTFARKYQSDFVNNFTKAVQYNTLSGTTLGYSEGTILGPHSWTGRISVAHGPEDTGVLPRIVENHEAGHATGNMNENYIYNYLIENGIIDKDKAGKYLLDADRGEISAHLSELPDYLGFTGYENGRYTGHPFGKSIITSTDVHNYNAWQHKNGFSHTIFDAINKGKMQDFVSFMNKHPFMYVLPTVGGISTTLAIPQNTELKKNGGILKAQGGLGKVPILGPVLKDLLIK